MSFVESRNSYNEFLFSGDLIEHTSQSVLSAYLSGRLRIAGTLGGFAIASGYTPVVINL